MLVRTSRPLAWLTDLVDNKVWFYTSWDLSIITGSSKDICWACQVQWWHGSVVWYDPVPTCMGYAQYAPLCPWYLPGVPEPVSSPVRGIWPESLSRFVSKSGVFEELASQNWQWFMARQVLKWYFQKILQLTLQEIGLTVCAVNFHNHMESLHWKTKS